MTRNWTTAGVALLAAVVVFAAHTFFVSATRPRQVDVLAAARDLRPGEALKDADLTVVQVYEDARVDAYFPPSERERLVGAYVLLPFVEGQPLTRSGVLASGGSRTLALTLFAPGWAAAFRTIPWLLLPALLGSVLTYWLTMGDLRRNLSVDAAVGLAPGGEGEIQLDRMGKPL